MNRLPNKGARVLLNAIELAGGQLVRVTGNGHLMVKGPAGTTTVGAHEIGDKRCRLNIARALRRQCGLAVAL